MTFIRAFAAIAFACLLAGPATAQVACVPGQTVADVIAIAEPLVESGAIEEVLVLEGDSLAAYVKSLNAMSVPVPAGLSHIVVAVRKDRTAAIFGFKDGCYNGKAQLGPGLHQKARGVEA
jgi:hypothetical protein